MWQIWRFYSEAVHFGVKNGSFSAFWHYKNKERFFEGFEIKLHIPSPCLYA